MLDSERSDGVYRNEKKRTSLALRLRGRPSARFAHDGAWLHAGWCISDLSTLYSILKWF